MNAKSTPLIHDLDATTDRLTAKLAQHYDRAAIRDRVKRCNAEFDAATSASRPEPVERLARQRLMSHAQG